ncbi:unnamed protein product [Nyctereutes procyonoides]|uniref:(raccoon dog) hypothetical protein n=1 Tax=Nyctereutes procyonoides TaxID=34880 RepID=A0A811Y9G9_NYCPR|nr:unnamed protein product [Nyctereutes procyonoides]
MMAQAPILEEFLGTSNKLRETGVLDCVKGFTTKEENRIQWNETLAAKAGLLGQPHTEVPMDGLLVRDGQQLVL